MKCVHELTINCRCPMDDTVDQYELRVETTRLMQVEDILSAVSCLPKKAFQEQITIELARVLRCPVTTVGFHSGVKTTCTA